MTTTARMMGEHASALIALDFRLIPLWPVLEGVCSCRLGPGCSAAGKHPRIDRWPVNASGDQAAVERWVQEVPNGGIGIATGCGLLVVDLDGPDGANEWVRLCEEHGDPPETLTARTARGRHLYYWVEDAMGTRLPTPTRSLSQISIDLRGDGGFVVAPPSMHASGKQYRWVDPDCEPAVIFDDHWIMTVLGKGSRPRAAGLTNGRADEWICSAPAPSKETLRVVQEGLEQLDPDMGYDDWLRVLMAVHDATMGHRSGLALVLDWSSNAKRKKAGGVSIFNPREIQSKWAGFQYGGDDLVTEATLWAMVQETQVEDRPPQTRVEPEIVVPKERVEQRGMRTITEVVEQSTGLIRILTKDIMAKALYPSPSLAYGSALAIMGAVFGRTFNIHNLNPSCLTVCIAPTGQGKDHPRKYANAMLHALGMERQVADQAASTAGLMDRLMDDPCLLVNTDEFGDYLAVALGPDTPPHIRGLFAKIREVHSASPGDSVMRRDRAKRDKRDQDPDEAMCVRDPVLNILGSTTPDQFWDRIGPAALHDGTIGRFLILNSLGIERTRQQPSSQPSPEAVVEMREAMRNADLLIGNFAFHRDPLLAARRAVIGFTDDADEANHQFCADNEKTGSPIWARAGEMAWRIAGITAISAWFSEEQPPLVTLEIMQQAIQVASISCETVAARKTGVGGGGSMSRPTAYSDAHAAITKLLRSAPGWTSEREMIVQAGNYARKNREEILKDLVDAGLVERRKKKPEGGVGRPKQEIRWIGD